MNDGFINEKRLIEYINGNQYGQYNDNIKEFLRFSFCDDFDDSDTFVAIKDGGQMKPDLHIIHNNIVKYVSVKKGGGNSVHQEPISVFFQFINDNMGEEYLNKLKLFHYGDDTINDTGTVRYGANECKRKYRNEVDFLNSAINEQNIEMFLDRFLFVGNSAPTVADLIYHGTIDNGLWATREEIVEYVKSNDFISNAVHFGPLTYQVWGRNQNRTAANPDRRYEMQIKWGSITRDLLNIRGE